VENEELSQLFAEAMEATDRRVDEGRRARDDEAEAVDAPVKDASDDDFDFDLQVDQTATNRPIDLFHEALARSEEDDSQNLAEGGQAEGGEAEGGQAEGGQAEGGQAEGGEAEGGQAEVSGDNGALSDPFGETLDDIEGESLNDIEVEPDTGAQIERLLASSFGPPLSDDDPDLAFPDFDDDDNITGLDGRPEGPASTAGEVESEAVAEAQREAASLRRQFNSVARTLTDRESELQSAESRIATLEAQVVQTARHSANTGREFDSFRRRSEREQEDTRKFAIEKLLKEFLSVLDNLERALEHAGEHRGTALGKGVEMTLEQFIEVLARAGAGRVAAAQGDVFDPNIHEAVGQQVHDTVPRDHVIRTLQNGLLLNERLVRAAMVVVSIGDGKEPAPESAAEDVGGKRKKKRRKKRKKKAEGAEAEGLEAAATDGSTGAPKKRRKKRKKKAKTSEAAAVEGEQTASKGGDDD
jgi:molecular chaperone GrpE